MGNFPRPLLWQQPSLVVSHAVGALSTYQTRASTGLHVILRSCFRRYTPAIYEVGRSVRVCYCTVLGVGERDSTPILANLRLY